MKPTLNMIATASAFALAVIAQPAAAADIFPEGTPAAATNPANSSFIVNGDPFTGAVSASFGRSGLAAGVNLLGTGRIDGTGSAGHGEFGIASEVSWIGFEIFVGSELGGVHKDAHHDWSRRLCCGTYEGEVAFMQCPHSGDCDASMERFQFRSGVNDRHRE